MDSDKQSRIVSESSRTEDARGFRAKGIPALLAISVAVSVIWLVVLPALSQRPAVQSRLQWLEEQKIDPSAMYYTELEIMEEILRRQR